ERDPDAVVSLPLQRELDKGTAPALQAHPFRRLLEESGIAREAEGITVGEFLRRLSAAADPLEQLLLALPLLLVQGVRATGDGWLRRFARRDDADRQHEQQERAKHHRDLLCFSSGDEAATARAMIGQ